jgi:hypothetical protein
VPEENVIVCDGFITDSLKVLETQRDILYRKASLLSTD